MDVDIINEIIGEIIMKILIDKISRDSDSEY